LKAELEKLGLHYRTVELGEVNIAEAITRAQCEQLKIALSKLGLELIEDQRAAMVEKIKNVIIEMIYYADEMSNAKHSDYISRKLNGNYNHLSNIFSEVTGTTIEHYIITLKIERAKELLLYDDLNLTQISYKLNYSSVAHLSNQFKKVTGLNPSLFKQIKHQNQKRLTLDKV